MKLSVFLFLLTIVNAGNIAAQAISVDSASSCRSVYDSVLRRSYYVITDKRPEYNAGIKKMMEIISKNLRWPGPRCCVEGSVYRSFVVEQDGTITGKRIEKGFGDGTYCDASKEAIKVLDFLTDWTPGQCNGQNVAVKYVIPIRFAIDTRAR